MGFNPISISLGLPKVNKTDTIGLYLQKNDKALVR